MDGTSTVTSPRMPRLAQLSYKLCPDGNNVDRRMPVTIPAPVWILHDGKLGLRNQAMGVAEALGLPFVEKTLAVQFPWRALPPALWLNALAAPGPGGDHLLPPWPLVAIAAGGRAAAPILAIRKAAKGRCLAVQIQNPHIAQRHFDLMVMPAHDRVTGPNVLVTLGAVHRVTRDKLDHEAGLWSARLAHLPRPRVAVLIGGNNGSYRLPPERMQQIAEQLATLARNGAGLMVTPSRRTGPECVAILQSALQGLPAVIWDGTGDNPYFGYLGLADHVLATADSISMITEATATGRPVQIIPLDGATAKFERFHDAMRQGGMIRPFTGTLESWDYPLRNDTAEAGNRIRQMLDARGWLEDQGLT
jgi:mitochondrial fission protein ELM1